MYRKGKPGELVRIVEKALQPEWPWYDANLGIEETIGRVAFIDRDSDKRIIVGVRFLDRPDYLRQMLVTELKRDKPTERELAEWLTNVISD